VGMQFSSSGPVEFRTLPRKALRSIDYFSRELQLYVLWSARSDLCTYGYWSSFFEVDFGPATPSRPLNSCILLKTGDAKSAKTQDLHFMHLNRRYGIRPITRDDPYGRGFGRRWKDQLDTLPPVRKRPKKQPVEG